MRAVPVSYTHLDVYKRQGLLCGSFLCRLCVLYGGVLFGFLSVLLELRQTAQRLHMTAVQIEHIRLEAGDLQTDAVILPLFSQTLFVGLVLDLVCAVACLLQQLVGIADDVRCV